MFLKGIRIYNYRSIDENGVELDDFGKVNILIGKNNSGKSNILRFISYSYQFVDNNYRANIAGLYNDPYNLFTYENKFFFMIKHEDEFSNYCFDKLIKNTNFIQEYNLIEEDVEIIKHSLKKLWIEYEAHDEKIFIPKDLKYEGDFGLPSYQTRMGPTNFNSLVAKLKSFVLLYSNEFILKHKTFIIENFRKIDNKKESYTPHSVEDRSQFFNGVGFINTLNAFIHPEAAAHKVRTRFKQFEFFLRDVLNNPKLKIEISDRKTIQIILNDEDNSVRPLSNLGTGIHQMLILALTVSMEENAIFCIEEPEIFIHPEVQRKFVRYLIENTNNQYFITTHSNAFINEAGLDVYRVLHNGHSTQVEKAIDSSSRNQILDDLGYKASDLLQTNFIIWVEGPSDRIYIRHWIGLTDKKLIEGIHYTIMFYGGRLLSHLSAHDEEINEFIDINKINRNAAIFIDSDKGNEGDLINDTKTRIIAEFGEKKFCLLTVGREIENYIDLETLNASLKEIGKEEIDEYDQYTDIFINQRIEKMKLAKEIVSRQTAVPTLGELNQQITELVVRIKKANE